MMSGKIFLVRKLFYLKFILKHVSEKFFFTYCYTAKQAIPFHFCSLKHAHRDESLWCVSVQQALYPNI